MAEVFDPGDADNKATDGLVKELLVIFPIRAPKRSEIGTWRRRLFFLAFLEGCHSHSHCHI